MAKNVKAIYEACQNLVKEIENLFEKDKNAQVPQEYLDTLRESFIDIIDFEKTHLITAHDQFYGCMLMNMDTAIDFSQKGAIDITVAKEPFVVSFNPLFCAKYKYAEFTGLLVSEILRLAYAHPATFAEYNHEKDPEKHDKLEKASSASISNMVQNDVHIDSSNSMLRLPNDAYTVSKLNDELKISPKRNESIDYYYRLLEKFQKNDGNSGKGNGQQNQQQQSSGNGGSGSQQMQGQGNQQSQQQMGSGNQNNKEVVSTANNGKGNPIHNWEGEDAEEQKERIKSMVRNVFDNLDDRQRGNMPSGLVEAIKALLAPPEINWKQILRKLIGSVPVPYRKTRVRLNRRQPYRSDLCGKLPKRVVNVVCVFDTSGSMSNRDLAYCMNEVFNIVKCYEGAKITIIECDCEVTRVYQAKNMGQLKTKMTGRGGTAFSPAIEYINGTNKEAAKKWPELSGKFKDALMVYFTDGYGEDSIPKPRTYRNLWVVLKDTSCLSLKNPYGDVKSLSMDKDWIKAVKENDDF